MAKSSGLPRFIEALIAAGGIVIMSPILVFAAILVKITSSGPVLFCQKRVGLNGKLFTLYKFRTMRIAQSGPLVTAASDGRITSVGRILRKAKLDEMPGLWNVVRGDMSFVGPRPEVPQFVNFDDALWQKILTVRPGITDPVTLKLRNEEDLLAKVEDKEEFYRDILQPYKMKGYAKFISTKSFATDIKIIYQTVKAVILPSSAPPPTLEEVSKDFV